MPKLPRLTGNELINHLKTLGFEVARQRGSHHFLKKGSLNTTVPAHRSRNLKIGTLRKILRDVQLTPQELIDLIRGR